VERVDGEAGAFSVRLRKKPRYIIQEKCTACGTCAEYCPIQIRDDYNLGLDRVKCIYVPYAQAVPACYTVDQDHCLYLNLKECRQCEQACGTNAIDLDQQEEMVNLEVGSIILSPGLTEFNAKRKAEYGYGRFANVMTSIEFERVLCASGPFMGHIQRPSDKKTPKRIAFLQCVGSRDVTVGNPYCSSVCCMYAIKEAIVALEHEPGLELSIFYMDMRTQGKGFEEFYERGKQQGITFVRSKVSSLKEIPETKNLIVHYAEEDGTLKEQEFDLVVLSVGLEPAEKAQELASTMGISLNDYRFSHTNLFSPIKTTREGIFVAGAFQGPKDIPETVIQSSGSVASVSSLLASARGSLVEEHTYPEELPIEDDPRIGVFVCHCGINIAGVVDVQVVKEYARTLPNVVFAEQNYYSCSQDNQENIKNLIKEHNLNRVVVTACSPRTHEPLFQETLREAGLNKCLFEMANIRDQCSWVHMHEKEAATEKAKDLLRMAVAKANMLSPLKDQTIPVVPSGLVIGGGVAGMVAALKLAEQGFGCTLVEKDEELGGNFNKIHYMLDGSDPHQFLEELKRKVMNHEHIAVHTKTEIESIAGYIGNFKTALIAQNGKEAKALEIAHGVIVVATGAAEYKPSEYLYGRDERVVTQAELEEKMYADPSGTSSLKQVVMIQCVGSREKDRLYCSKLCCSKAIKNALTIKKLNPACEVAILYRDIRTYGFREDFYSKAREAGVLFIHYDLDSKPEVAQGEGALSVAVTDPVLGERLIFKPDALVLSPAIVSRENEEISRLLKIPLTQDGFFLEAHVKLRPVDFAVDGIFLCGLAHFPKPVDESIAQAAAAAARAAIPLAKGKVDVEPIVSSVDQADCFGCGICEYLCPYNAIRLVETEKGKKAETVSASCKGCGLCAAHCPKRTITMGRFTSQQIEAQIHAMLAK
jgi:heterodisulfide reductase subunit A